jgi:hypothetical protein
MKKARPSVALGYKARRFHVVLLAAAAATSCGGDDTEVVPLPDSGRITDGASDSDRSAGGGAGVGGNAGSGGSGNAGRGGAAGGLAGNGGAGTGGAGAGAAGAAGAGAAGTSGAAGGRSDGGGMDSGAPDGRVDSGVADSDLSDSPEGDGGADAQPDADAGAPLTIDQYQKAVAVAWCDRLAECCQLDATHFDRTKCLNILSTGFGPDQVFVYLRAYVGDSAAFPATLSFSADQAAQCVSLQRTRGCASEDGVEKRNLYTTCMNAVQGSALTGAPCKTSQECRASNYCRPGDGGVGNCAPIGQLNQTCNDPNQNGDQCNYLGIHSATSLHCSPLGGTGGTCVAGLPDGQPCNSDQECTSGVCSLLNGACVASQPNYPGARTCKTFTIVDDAGRDAGAE